MTVNYSIIQVKKLNRNNLNIAEDHNLRKIPVPTADETGRFFRILNHSNETLRREIDSRIKKYKINRVQKNSVVALEIVLSASRKYFLKNTPKKYNDYCKTKIFKWLDVSLAFLKSEFEERLVCVDIHLDETTPHLHAIIFPANQKLVKQVGRKSSNTLKPSHNESLRYCLDSGKTLNKAKLTHYLDRYSEYTEQLGIVRPKRNVKANKRELIEFYKLVHEKQDMNEENELLEKKRNKLNSAILKGEVTLKTNEHKIRESKKELENFALNLKKSLNEVVHGIADKDYSNFEHLISALQELQVAYKNSKLEEINDLVPDLFKPR